jgi:hypothetical protein
LEAASSLTSLTLHVARPSLASSVAGYSAMLAQDDNRADAVGSGATRRETVGQCMCHSGLVRRQAWGSTALATASIQHMTIETRAGWPASWPRDFRFFSFLGFSSVMDPVTGSQVAPEVNFSFVCREQQSNLACRFSLPSGG